MSGGGQPPGGPAPQPPPAVAAALEATRAKFNLMQQQQGARGGQPNGAAAGARPAGVAGPVGSIPVGRAAGAPPPPLTSARNNPMFGEAAILSPDKKVDREYTPKLADAIRAPSPSGTLQPDGALPPVGDLFAPRPALPAYLKEGASSAPRLPDWDSRRPYLTGRFLYDAAVDGKSSSSSEASRPPALDAYPAGVQESLLVDDLLSAFLGLSGGYVRVKPLAAPGGQRLGYEVAAQGQLEPALAEMAARMLPICEYVATIQRFVETRRAYEWGLVAQALAGAMRHVLQDWELMVAQLEHQLRSGKLTLQALWYYVQPPRSALKLVASLAAEASAGRLRGASLLDLLHARCAGAMGDAAAHRLALRLLRAAAEPYFGMLERWLCEGTVDDPYGEFMVQENKDIGRESHTADNQSAYWHERWTLRPAFDPQTGAPLLQQGSGSASQQPQHDVPAFLQRQKQLVLNTGKYLSVMRECAAQPPRTLPLGTHLEYDEGGRYALLIEDAHAAASSAAMELLRRSENLADGLAVLKRYFLTAQGDMLLHLMDAAEPEFGSPVGAVPLLQLQSLLESAVRGSSAASDPAAAHLAAAWDHRSILNMLIANQAALAAPGPGGEGAGAGGSKTPFSKLKPTTPAPMTVSERNNFGKKRSARESFMLAYEVPWPLSIAAPEAALAQYQMVFRHIFELKWVERELNRVVALYAQTTGVASRRARARRASLDSGGSGAADTLAATLAHSYSTCQVMTHFFRQYLMYVTFEVMEPLWAAFEAKVKTASSLDEIVEQHKAFLRRLMKGCLLSRKVVVLRALLNLKELALRFVRLSDEAAAVNWAALEEEAEQKALGSGGRKTERQRELRLLKAALARSELERRLSQPTFAASISDLHGKFVLKVCEFINALGVAHKDAQRERSDTREELESLLNLMSRLDFNGYFSARAPPPPPKEEGKADGGLASAGSERMTVQFAQ